MEIKKSYEENKAIYVKEENLRYFHDFLLDFSNNVNYKAGCIDGTTIEFKNLEELVNYENPYFRKIKNIEILGHNEKTESNLYYSDFQITLGTKYSNTISYNYRFKSLAVANRFENELNLRLKEIRPWYWLISKFDFSLGISLIWGLAALILGVGSIKKKIENPESVNNTLNLTINEYLVLTFIGVALIYLTSIPLNKIKNYIFPKFIFEIGRQKEKNRIRSQIIYLIGTAVILSIIINIISGFIYDVIK